MSENIPDDIRETAGMVLRDLDMEWAHGDDDLLKIARALLAERNRSGWQPMETAPRDGKHCILSVKEGPFFYSVQGSYSDGQWNAVHRANVDPLYWMPNVLHPSQAPSRPSAEQEKRA